MLVSVQNPQKEGKKEGKKDDKKCDKKMKFFFFRKKE